MTSDSTCTEPPDLSMILEATTITQKKADSVIVGEDSDRERKDSRSDHIPDRKRRSLPTDRLPRSQEGSETVHPTKPRRTASSTSRTSRLRLSNSSNSQEAAHYSIDRSRPAAISRANSISSSKRGSSIYDGQRRPRHVRSQASVMTPEHIERAIDLHRRSCNIFKNPASGTVSPAISRSPSLSGPPAPPHSILRRSATDPVVSSSHPPQRGAPGLHNPVLYMRPAPPSHSETENDCSEHQFVPATIIHWTSPSTRRREYEELDRQSKGIRRLWRKVRPRCWGSESAMVQLYDSTTASDRGSIRRYRIDEKDEDGQPEAESTPKKRDGSRGPRIKRWMSTTFQR